ncbi:coiled-coil-helix-coiled-coil-helix domain containing 5 [Rhinolophus ferrumequinum]|uniref:Coiled-coil-helix-coiled-coil-helix domain containing 5 n=1 Tax=Rhinolophus ferrumequinum TaxID=59479 RepID=A0A7J7R2L9_RHIFE|nr:coiled-coil-helix-coiled-coil-helix domain containing 5 [Rhinolophus ferrumequinum]
MQAALEVTARYCSRELDQYGQCVAAKPESWQRDCHHLKMSIAQCTSSQSARPAPSPSRPSRSVCGRTRRPRASVQSRCAASCSAPSACRHRAALQPCRHSHCLPPEDTLDRRKMTGVTATWCPQPWRVARCPEGSGLGTHNK